VDCQPDNSLAMIRHFLRFLALIPVLAACGQAIAADRPPA
jgi:hypothetical protein